MTTRLTFPASMFSVVCQRCGSTMRKNADSCPNCGADRTAALGARRAAAPASANSGMFEQTASASAAASASAGASLDGADRAEPTLRPGWPAWDAKRASERIAQKAAEYRARRAEMHARSAYADSSNDPDALPGSDRWSRNKTFIAAACGAVLLAGAAFYLQQSGSSDSGDTDSADHSVSGAIDAKVGSLVRGAIDTGNTATTAITPARRTPSEPRALTPGDPLSGVRTALDQHDLGAARARLKALPAQQQTREEYEALKDEMIKRELQRDAALQLARACERTSAWACVQQNAGEALALDGGNIESQAMLERVISHAGWLAPSASAALAKKTPSAPAANATAPAPSVNAANTTPKPVVGAPAQANVAAAAPAAKPNSAAQKAAERQRAAQRTAAARAAAEEARADSAYDSRAEKIARAQVATNAITAATVAPSPSVVAKVPAPAVVTPPTQVQAPTQMQAAAQQPAQPAVRTTPAPAAQAATQAPAPAPTQAATQAQPAVKTPAPAAQAAAPRAPYYLGEEEPKSSAPSAQPAARAANPRTPYYLGEDPPQQAAPAVRSAVPRPPQSTGQSSSIEPSALTVPTTAATTSAATTAAVPKPPAAVAQPMPNVVAPRAAAAAATATATAPPAAATVSPATTPAVAPRSAQSAATAASPQFAPMPAGAHLDSDKSEELERAIKQYGWSSNGDSSRSQKPLQ
ncbi:zinc ribbon domain-containing protein [Caballeronia sp. LZ034LL]|uniref:zinc ribbon domain-containing protein n=1 Tax=Caballeronia sp. LZ034LL TaxID=3038567 RepID=UPI002862A790|nr:zinc ribbon domain-containing protein [Caballeronia sp. LZ034LL]MDR5838953.1 zinc ribbon domain-containing protein [Caballeronia sp. LZ034LL]